MKSSVSIALFFLLSAFFLFALLAALEHSKKALAIAIACLAGVVCIIVFLTPVRVPSWLHIRRGGTAPAVTSTTTTVARTTTTGLPSGTTIITTTTISTTTTTGAAR